MVSLRQLTVLVVCSLVVVLIPERGMACSCSWQGSFLEVAQDDRFINVVVRGIVKPHPQGKNSVQLEVLEVLHGLEKRSRVRVWGDNGSQCRPYVSVFPPGTEWVMALRSVTPNEGRGVPENLSQSETLNRQTDYAISGCGNYALQVVDGNLQSIYKDSRYAEPERLTLEKLRLFFSKNP